MKIGRRLGYRSKNWFASRCTDIQMMTPSFKYHDIIPIRHEVQLRITVAGHHNENNGDICHKFWESFVMEDLIENTKYGEQLCTIGALDQFNIYNEKRSHLDPVVLRQVLHPSEKKHANCSWLSILSPRMFHKDEKRGVTFVVYDMRNTGKFEMTLGWYLKMHRKHPGNSLFGGHLIEPAFVLRSDGQWAFSDTFKGLFLDLVKLVDGLHRETYTHGHLSPNNIVVSSGFQHDSIFNIQLINCLQQHDVTKENEIAVFEALVKKDCEDIHKLIKDVTSGMENCLEPEVDHLLNMLKTCSDEKSIKRAFNHPGLWSRQCKSEHVYKMKVKALAKEVGSLGFLEPNVDWRKMVHENILARIQEEARYWMGSYREDYNGEFNESILDLLCFIKDTYRSYELLFHEVLGSMGYKAMDEYLQALFPNFFLKLHELMKTKASLIMCD